MSKFNDVDVDSMDGEEFDGDGFAPERPSGRFVDVDAAPQVEQPQREQPQRSQQLLPQDFRLPQIPQAQPPQFNQNDLVQQASTAATEEVERRMAAQNEQRALVGRAGELGGQLDTAAEMGDLPTYHNSLREMNRLLFSNMLKQQKAVFDQFNQEIQQLKQQLQEYEGASSGQATQAEFDRELALRPDLGPAVQATAQNLVRAYQRQGSQNPQGDANAFIAHAWEVALSNGVSPLETLAEIGKSLGVQTRRSAPPPSIGGPAEAATPRRPQNVTTTLNPWADAMRFNPSMEFST